MKPWRDKMYNVAVLISLCAASHNIFYLYYASEDANNYVRPRLRISSTEYINLLDRAQDAATSLITALVE